MIPWPCDCVDVTSLEHSEASIALRETETEIPHTGGAGNGVKQRVQLARSGSWGALWKHGEGR